jgi:6-phosphogluconolactonase
MNQPTQTNLVAFVGTYTSATSATVKPVPPSRGIYAFGVDEATGDFKPSATAYTTNPSFLAVHPAHTHLYAVNEGEASVAAFAIVSPHGELRLINQQHTIGTAPCHLVVDATQRHLIVANYGTGSVALFPINPEGGLGRMSDFVQQVGRGPNPARQEGPHAHSVTLSPDNRFVFVCDLGLDRVFVYRLDGERGRLVPNGSAAVPVGAGPRHFSFHPSGKFAYCINELAGSITAFAYDGAHGHLVPVQTIATLPHGFAALNYCADIHVHASGKFVYGSNRGHDSIAVFAVDEATGQLAPRGHAPTLGEWPRNFAISPNGQFLFAANQETDTIVRMRINPATGALSEPTTVATPSRPVCIKFAHLPHR